MQADMEAETAEQMQLRHSKERQDLQGRITNKKKNAKKKTRKGISDECAELERQLSERQAAERAGRDAGGQEQSEADGEQDSDGPEPDEEGGRPETKRLTWLEGKLKEKLESGADKLHLSSAASSVTGHSKKRSRHKDRLARRAAEQEAARRQAEREAASMTDHRARESAYMRDVLQTYGLVEHEVAPDGHCLFSAVADQLRQHGMALGAAPTAEPGPKPEPDYRTVRRMAAAYLLEHGDDFAPFVDEELAAYAGRVRDTAEWGGQVELMALARQYGVEMRVVHDERLERIGEDEGKASGKTLWLAYYRHGYGLGEHYNSLRTKKEQEGDEDKETGQ